MTINQRLHAYSLQAAAIRCRQAGMTLVFDQGLFFIESADGERLNLDDLSEKQQAKRRAQWLKDHAQPALSEEGS